jgi:hypothetical protein
MVRQRRVYINTAICEQVGCYALTVNTPSKLSIPMRETITIAPVIRVGTDSVM